MTLPPALQRSLCPVGFAALLVGALDPLEGSLLIVPGSVLVALGTQALQADRRQIVFRGWMAVLIALGVSALWLISARGGLGGPSGLSWAWGLAVLPYLVGLGASLCGPGSPRWVLVAGVGVGLLYLVLPGVVLWLRGREPQLQYVLPLLVFGLLGAAIVGGCGYRLRRG